MQCSIKGINIHLILSKNRWLHFQPTIIIMWVKFSYIVAESYTTISINDDSPFVAWRFYCDYRCGETILIYTKELVEKIKSIPEFTIVDFERVIVDELESIIMSNDENECMHYNNSTHYAPGGLAFDAPFPAEATADNTEDNDIYPYDMACHFIFHNHTEMLDFANRHQLSLSQI